MEKEKRFISALNLREALRQTLHHLSRPLLDALVRRRREELFCGHALYQRDVRRPHSRADEGLGNRDQDAL